MTAPDKPALKAAAEVLCGQCGLPAGFGDQQCASAISRDVPLRVECDMRTIENLRTENARLLAELEAARGLDTGSEQMARIQEQREMQARAEGAFDAAVCFQQYAEWIRCRTPIKAIRGTPAKTLHVDWSNGMTRLQGDALDQPEALADIAHELVTIAGINSAREGAWIPVGERMPEPQQIVVFVEDGVRQFGCWGGGRVWWRADGEESYHESEVTHWMPLPAPPTPEG